MEEPEITLSIHSPANGASLVGDVPFLVSGAATIEPESYWITTVQVKVGDGAYEAATLKPGGLWDCTTKATTAGSVVIAVRAEADNGEGHHIAMEQMRTVSVQLDTGKPFVIVSSGPINNQVIGVSHLPFDLEVCGGAGDVAWGGPATGVRQVEWSVDGGPFVPATPSPDWANWVINLSAAALRPYHLRILAHDNAGNTSLPTEIAFTLVDKGAPTLEITIRPDPIEVISNTGDELVINLQGTSEDTLGEVDCVEWVLDDGTTYQKALTNDNWAHWRADIPVSTPLLDAGTVSQSITVRATDKSGNSIVRKVPFKVSRAFKPVDPFGQVAYLNELLTYAENHVVLGNTESSPSITRGLLSSAFHQPFATLLNQPAALVNEPLHQVRLSVEILRKYLEQVRLSAPPVAEQLYRMNAYATLLKWLGTSYDELRMALGAEVDVRSSLAERLGVPADKLDSLSLPPDQVSEEQLEQLFGLARTEPGEPPRSPAGALAASSLLRWQTTHLRTIWSAQDHLPSADPARPPMVDPDLVRQADLRDPIPGNPAFDLWNARRAWLDTRDRELKQARAGQAAPFEDFKQVLALTWGSASDIDAALTALEVRRRDGEAIDSDLTARGLTLPAFAVLMRARGLALAGTIKETDWQELDAILVQAQKLRQYAGWRTEEAQTQVTLGPDFFTIAPDVAPDITPTSRVFSTGLDANDLPLPAGAIDPHWTITATPKGTPPASLPAYATLETSPPFNSAWPPNSSTSRWISPKADQSAGDAPGSYTYRTTFSLRGYDLASVALGLRIAADNELLDVRLNGTSLGLVDREFNLLGISSGFYAETNTLEFIVQNGGVAANPTGLRVELFFAEALRPQLQRPAWRESARQRRDWEGTLRARKTQVQDLAQALQVAVDAAAEAALPVLRDVLCEAAHVSVSGGDTATWLTRRLLIDMRAGAAQRTTRVQQAIEALQTMLFGLRTGRFAGATATLEQANPTASWRLRQGVDFDADWRWLGSDETWRAAMQTFYYPDRLLLPSLRRPSAPPSGTDDPTSSFVTLIEDLRKHPRLTRETAQALADTYLASIRNLPDDVLPTALRSFLDTFRITEQLIPWDLGKRLLTITSFFGTESNPHDVSVYYKEIFYFVPMALALQLEQAGEYVAALDWFQTVYAAHLPVDQRKIYYGLVLECTPAGVPTSYQRESDWLRDPANPLNPHQIARRRTCAYTRFTIMSEVRCLLNFADAEFTRATDESLPRARTLYMDALDLLDLPEMQPAVAPHAPPPDPQILALRQRATANLRKLRSGRNIAGMQLQTFGSDALTATAAARFRPTPYYYTVVIERAKNLVALAQQMEGAYLAALEKTDSETYDLIKAGHDLHLARASVELQQRRVVEARDGQRLADLQEERAQVQLDTYDQWIETGWLADEHKVIGSMTDAIAQYEEAGRYGMRAAVMGAITGGMSGAQSGVGFGGSIGALFGPVGAAIGAVVGGIAGAGAGASGSIYAGKSQRASSRAAAASTQASIYATQTSYERRDREWKLQKRLAQQDRAIGEQQIALAEDRTQIVLREQAIAQIQQEHARAVAEFLANKFTSAELYEWMSGVLGGVYRYFLQQATALAQLAQSQLAFERQEPVPSFIQTDYWQPPAGGATSSATPDRRGMTGSARLLQDIYQLDQHAFETNKRKLQLVQTFSLARLAPLELQRFRQTGVLPFATPMEQFDRAFPGHYLRLIKRVRVSVVALIPPIQGIRATLINSGVSRVAIAGDHFQTAVVRRDPELIALSAPTNATGVFDLDAQSDMLLPFEGTGVDTTWELQMPRASNPFDFSTIADVLLTIEYTALHSFDYQQEVIRRLDRTVQADRAFSLRQHFPDQWYDLHNPAQTSAPMTVSLRTLPMDFPPNIEELTIAEVVLAFTRADGATFEIEVEQLNLTPAGGTVVAGGGATSIDGVISTRRGTWTALAGRSPIGTWTLKLPNTPQAIDRFAHEEIEDVLLLISYRGLLPAWPQ